MRTRGKVNTIDGPGKKFRPAFSFAPQRGYGIILTAFLEICFKYITTSTYNKVLVKKSRARFRLGSGRPSDAGDAVKAGRLAILAVSLGNLGFILPDLGAMQQP